jgi:hypothetical protein
MQALKMATVLALALASSAMASVQADPLLKETPGAFSGSGYKTVADALAGLKQRPGAVVEVTKPDGWTVVTLPEPQYELWSFTPPGHYAHPAAVRRAVKQNSRGTYVEMTALCEADKASCDRLMREFQALNQKMREDVQHRAE